MIHKFEDFFTFSKLDFRFNGEKIVEKIEEYDFGFSTEIEPNDVSFVREKGIITKGEQFVNTGKFVIGWDMDFDNRKHGINSMAPVITAIRGTYTLITPTDDKDIEEEATLFIEKGSDWKFECEINKFEFGDAISPSSIEFDFKDKKITIQF